MNNNLLKIAFISLSLFLTACGGSSDSSTEVTDSSASEGSDDSSASDDSSDDDAQDENAGLDVDATLFLTGENVSIDTVSCTLVNGTQTLCYEITSKHTAEEHDMGPWCPETIYDTAEEGGLWFDKGEINDLDGAFIENLATYYDDPRL